MTLIIITGEQYQSEVSQYNVPHISSVVMGLTQTVLYIAPVLGLQLSLSTRVYISALIQLLVGLMETVETMFKQVSTSSARRYSNN